MVACDNAKQPAAQTPQQRYRTKLRRAGVTQLNVLVPKKLTAEFQRFVTAVREGKQPSRAFEKAFPGSAKAIAKRYAAKLPRSRG
jgi:hypothetical protein